MDNPCRDCQVCCGPLLRIVSLDKPGGVACPHLGPQGCQWYGNRPNECRGFVCLWLATRGTLMTDADRPDLLGVMFQPKLISEEPGLAPKDIDGMFVKVYELEGFDIAVIPRAQELIAAIRHAGLGVVVSHRTRNLLRPQKPYSQETLDTINAGIRAAHGRHD